MKKFKSIGWSCICAGVVILVLGGYIVGCGLIGAGVLALLIK